METIPTDYQDFLDILSAPLPLEGSPQSRSVSSRVYSAVEDSSTIRPDRLDGLSWLGAVEELPKFRRPPAPSDPDLFSNHGVVDHIQAIQQSLPGAPITAWIGPQAYQGLVKGHAGMEPLITHLQANDVSILDQGRGRQDIVVFGGLDPNHGMLLRRQMGTADPESLIPTRGYMMWSVDHELGHLIVDRARSAGRMDPKADGSVWDRAYATYHEECLVDGYAAFRAGRAGAQDTLDSMRKTRVLHAMLPKPLLAGVHTHETSPVLVHAFEAGARMPHNLDPVQAMQQVATIVQDHALSSPAFIAMNQMVWNQTKGPQFGQVHTSEAKGYVQAMSAIYIEACTHPQTVSHTEWIDRQTKVLPNHTKAMTSIQPVRDLFAAVRAVEHASSEGRATGTHLVRLAVTAEAVHGSEIPSSIRQGLQAVYVVGRRQEKLDRKHVARSLARIAMDMPGPGLRAALKEAGDRVVQQDARHHIDHHTAACR